MILASMLLAAPSWAPWIRPDEVSLDLKVEGPAAKAYSPILVDLERNRTGWGGKVWAYWYLFNKADHVGTVTSRRDSGGTEVLQIKLQVRPDIWVKGGEANLRIRLKSAGSGFQGTFEGDWVGKPVRGTVEGSRPSSFLAKAEGFRNWRREEHPRLLFRAGDLGALRRRARTPEGRAIVERMKELVQRPYTGRNGAFVAAAHAFLFHLEGDRKHIEIATDIVTRTIENRVGNDDLWVSQDKMIRKAQPAHGVALTYDLLYNEWPTPFRERVAKALEAKQADLIMGGGTGFNLAPWSNWQGITRGSMGVTALAILGDPGTTDANLDHLRIAERSLRRFIRFGVGSGGYFHEGDGYLNYSSLEGVLPFVRSYRNTLGIDLARTSGIGEYSANWTRRMVRRDDGKWVIPNFGPGGSQVGAYGPQIMSLAVAPKRDVAAAKGTFDRIFGLAGDRTFDIGEERPDLGIWALVSYPFGQTAKDPGTRWGLYHEDLDKGYFLARNHWGADAVSVGLYLKQEPRPESWSLQDAGAFKIAGLGVEWATKADPDRNDRVSENAVTVGDVNTSGPGEVIHKVAYPDGSFVVTSRLDRIYETLRGERTTDVKHTRSFLTDFSPAEGSVAVFGVYDKISGGGEKVWRMHTRGEVTLKGNQFIIRKGIKALIGRVTRPAGARLEAKGQTLTIKNPRPGLKDQEFFVVMALQDRIRPEALTDGDGVRVDNISYGIIGNRLRLPR